MSKFQSVTRFLVMPLMVAVVISTSSFAQDGEKKGRGGQRGPGGPRGFSGFRGPGGGGTAGLLNNPKVQEVLEVTEEQKNEIREIMRVTMEKARADVEKKIQGVLNEKQSGRILGLIVQMEGTRSLLNDEVAAKVGLDAEQKAIIKGALESGREQFGKLFEKVRSGDIKRENIREEMDKIRKQGEADALGTLSADQKKTFEDLKGEIVEGLRDRGRGGAFGGTRQRRGGEGGGRPRRGDAEKKDEDL